MGTLSTVQRIHYQANQCYHGRAWGLECGYGDISQPAVRLKELRGPKTQTEIGHLKLSEYCSNMQSRRIRV